MKWKPSNKAPVILDTKTMSKKGYQGFGSFHSDNVEELVRLSDEEFDTRCPPLPFECPISEYISRIEGPSIGGLFYFFCNQGIAVPLSQFLIP